MWFFKRFFNLKKVSYFLKNYKFPLQNPLSFTNIKIKMKTKLIDIHCHLEMDVFNKDRDEVINRAMDAGIAYTITIGSDEEANIKGLRISDDYPEVYAAVGIHPHDAKILNDNLYDEMTCWVKHPKVAAVGEIGLDYHYMHSQKDVQINAFKRQIAIAKDS